MEEDLHAFLKQDPGLTALVAGRVHYDVRPQGGALPAVTFRQASAGDDYELAGEATNAEPVIEIEGHAETYLGARAVAKAIRGAMRRLADGGIIGATKIDCLFCEDETPLAERKADASNDVIFTRALDFTLQIHV